MTRTLVGRFIDWLSRARDDEPDWIFVGSAHFTTSWTNKDGGATDKTRHFVSFFEDAHGNRSSSIESPILHAAECHSGVQTARHNWERFGELPSWTRKSADRRQPPNLVAIRGGLDSGGDAA